MRFNAIVFRPFKGEVFDAVVTQVNKLGFFAQVGPLQVFVSKHLIPSDMKFDPQATPAAYVSEISDEQPQRVTKDSEVRARCMHTHAHVDVWGDVAPPLSPRLPLCRSAYASWRLVSMLRRSSQSVPSRRSTLVSSTTEEPSGPNRPGRMVSMLRALSLSLVLLLLLYTHTHVNMNKKTS